VSECVSQKKKKKKKQEVVGAIDALCLLGRNIPCGCQPFKRSHTSTPVLAQI
jgi:hypothetical protein